MRSHSPLAIKAPFAREHGAQFLYALYRLLGKPVNLLSLHSEGHVIAPATETDVHAAIFEPSDLRGVLAVAPHTSWDTETKRIQAGCVSHAETRIYKLDHAIVSGGYVYAGHSRSQVALTSSPLAWQPVTRERSGMLCCSVFSSQFFGHWLTDQLTTELLAQELCLTAYSANRQSPYRHEAAIRHATDLRVRQVDRAAFDSLWMAVDFGQNPSKLARYLRLRARLREGAKPTPSRGVFILRGQSGTQRHLVNEQALCAQLSMLGFRVLDPGRDSTETMRNVLYDAPIVIGVEGSALVHGVMLMPRSACLAVIQPPRRFNNVLKNYTDCLGQHYAFTVADDAEGGFELPLPKVLRLLDRIERALA